MKYECLLGNQNNSNPKLFYSYIKQNRVSHPSIFPIKTKIQELHTDPILI